MSPEPIQIKRRCASTLGARGYRGTSLRRNRTPLGPYSRTMHRALWWPYGGLLFLMSEVPLPDIVPCARSDRHPPLRPPPPYVCIYVYKYICIFMYICSWVPDIVPGARSDRHPPRRAARGAERLVVECITPAPVRFNLDYVTSKDRSE